MATSAASRTNQLTASIRGETGKGASRRARRAGKVPAVLYGHGSDPRHLELNAHDYAAVLRNAGSNAVLALDIEGKEQLALTKALAVHPLHRTIQHADLLVVRRGEKVVVEINVVVEGEAAPGTLVTQESSAVEIEAEALSIPEELTVSVEDAEPGTQFTAGQLALPRGVTLISDPELLVVNVVTAPTEEDMEGEVEEAEAGAEAEPEGEPESEGVSGSESGSESE